MTDTQTTEVPMTDEEHAREMAHVGAVHRLARGRISRPELGRAEAQARVALAPAIMSLDETDDRIEAGEKIHNLQEQANVELASRAYTQALANLVRGEG